MVETGRVIAYLDKNGRVAFNYPSDIEFSTQNIYNTEKIINETTSITVEPAATFPFKVGEIVSAVRDLLGSQVIEAATDILNPVTKIVGGATTSVIQGLGSGVMSMLSSVGYDVNIGDVSNVRNFFGWGDSGTDQDLYTETSQLTKYGGTWERLGTGSMKIAPPSGYKAEVGDVSNTREFKGWHNIIGAEKILNDGLEMGTTGGLNRVGTGDITLGPTTGYKTTSAEELHSQSNIESDWIINSAGCSLGAYANIWGRESADLNIYSTTSAYDVVIGSGGDVRNLSVTDNIRDAGIVEATIRFIIPGKALIEEGGGNVNYSAYGGYNVVLDSPTGKTTELISGAGVFFKPAGGYSVKSWNDVIPDANETHDCGIISLHWDRCRAYQFIDYGGGYLDLDYDDLEVVRGRRPQLDDEGNPIRDKRGRMRLDYESLPPEMVQDRDLPKRYWGVGVSDMISVNSGAIVKVDDKVEIIMEFMNDLQKRVEELEGGV